MIPVVQVGEVKRPYGIVFRGEADRGQILLLALDGECHVVLREGLRLNSLVELHFHLVHVGCAHGLTVQFHACDAVHFERLFAAVFEGELVFHAIEHGRSREIVDEVEAVLVEPIAAIDQRAVGLPYVIYRQLLVVAQSHDAQ